MSVITHKTTYECAGCEHREDGFDPELPAFWERIGLEEFCNGCMSVAHNAIADRRSEIMALTYLTNQ